MVQQADELSPNGVYTLQEVCRLLKISEPTARRWLKSGLLRGRKIGGGYRFLGRDVLDSMEGGRALHEELELLPFGPDHPLLALDGIAESGHDDIADEHDRYLAEWAQDEA